LNRTELNSSQKSNSLRTELIVCDLLMQLSLVFLFL